MVGTIGRAGSPIEYLDAPEFQAYWDTDARRMVEVVARIGAGEIFQANIARQWRGRLAEGAADVFLLQVALDGGLGGGIAGVGVLGAQQVRRLLQRREVAAVRREQDEAREAVRGE